MQLILASSNAHKAEELSEHVNGYELSIVAADEKLDVLEDGDTFEANAFKKAQAYFNRYGEPVIADDSGLIVEKLPHLLGVQSARFGGGKEVTASERNQELLKVLQQKGLRSAEDRRAYFSCTLCVYLSDAEIYFFTGKVEGHIGDEEKGSDGFGYDPLFVPSEIEGGAHLAELKDWKLLNSHRSRAVQNMMKFFVSKGIVKKK